MTKMDAVRRRAHRLRLWPGVAIVAAIWLARVVPPIVGFGATVQFTARVVGGIAAGIAFVIWWLIFSRARWSERLGGLALLGAGAAGIVLAGDDSLVLWLLWYGPPVLSLAFVSGLIAGEKTHRSPVVMAGAAIVLTCAFVTLLRIDGVHGNGIAQFAWRWTPSAEEQLLAATAEGTLPEVVAEPNPGLDRAAAPASEPAANGASAAPGGAPPRQVAAGPASHGGAATAADEHIIALPAERPRPRIEWAGFRGPDRNGIVTRAAQVVTDWSSTPPVELWRQPIGPGWSSFAVRDDLLYTQEQRGTEELVTAYAATTGRPVWRHRDTVRFDEPMGGAGPRATPSVDEARVYALGATGILNALDAESGAVVWSRNAASESGVAVPIWGFAGSPLLVDDLVVVALAGKLAAFERATGRPRWVGPNGGDGYASPQLASIAGVRQVIMASGTGMIGVAPSSGTVLWSHAWTTSLPLMPIAQPALVENTLLVGDSFNGVRRVALGRNADVWTANELWSSIRLKPYFNDFVVHRGHAYGFDGAILACISLEDGERRWKGGRYGQGQLVLLPDRDLLLVISEEGELILVRATPDEHKELARFPALRGKTWNHPVMVDDVVYVRNGEEMAAFRLPRTR